MKIEPSICQILADILHRNTHHLFHNNRTRNSTSQQRTNTPMLDHKYHLVTPMHWKKDLQMMLSFH
jgi:hypothetical protein